MVKVLLIILCFHSLHGLVRGENMELGCDSDTGGQVKLTNCSPPFVLGVLMPNYNLNSCLKARFLANELHDQPKV